MNCSKYIGLLAGLLLCLNATAQDVYDLKVTPDAKGKKFGYSNIAGEMVIPAVYDEAQPFFQGLAIVRKGSSYGVTDANHNFLLPLKYNYIAPADEHTFLVAVDGRIKDGHLQGEKYGYISTRGEVIVKPEYVEMLPFDKHGLAYIRHKSGKCGFIGRNYKFVIPAEFDFVGLFNDSGVTWLNKGGSLDNSGQVKGGRFYIVNAAGDMFIPGEFASVGYFEQNHYVPSAEWLNQQNATHKRLFRDGNASYNYYRKFYLNTEPGKKIPENLLGYWASPDYGGYNNGVYTVDGKTLFEPGKYRSISYPSGDVVPVAVKDGQWNFLNMKTGQPVLTSEVKFVYNFENGYALCETANGWYVVDEKGGACSKGYDFIYPASDGMHIVKGRNGYGIIGMDGHEILPATISDIWPIKDGYAIVKVGIRFAYAGKEGLATEPQFSDAVNFKHGYAWAKTADGWDLYDTQFRKRNKYPLSEGTYNGSEPYFWGKNMGTDLFECFNLSDGNKTFDETFSVANAFSAHRDGVALVAHKYNKKKFGFIDRQGRPVIPLEFDQETALRAFDKYVENGRRPWSEYDTHFLKLHSNPARNKFALTQTLDESFWDF